MPTIYYTYYTPVSSKILEVAAQEGKLGLRLLSHGLEELYGIHMSVDDISQHLTREEHGKPRLTDYPEAKDYLEGLTVTSEDYKEVFKRYKDVPGVVFLVDPPYLSTEVGTYKMYWRLADYLDVLNVLKGHAFVYFTSNKSSILELCDWMGRNPFLGNPFGRCRKVEFNASVNYNARYTDMMLYTVSDEVTGVAA